MHATGFIGTTATSCLPGMHKDYGGALHAGACVAVLSSSMPDAVAAAKREIVQHVIVPHVVKTNMDSCGTKGTAVARAPAD